MLGQFQDIAFEGSGIATTFIGKGHRHLANRTAGRTAHSGDIQHDLDGAWADGKASKPSLLESPAYDPTRATDGTAKIPPLLTDGENHLAALILRLDILVAANPKPVIQ